MMGLNEILFIRYMWLIQFKQFLKMARHYPYPNMHQNGKLDNYNSIKHELQQQTQNLMKERNFLNQKYAVDIFPSQNTIIEQSGLEEEDNPGSYLNHSTPIRDNDPMKKKLVKNKIQEIIQICKTDKEGSVNEFTEVIEAEKQILNFLFDPPNHSSSNSKPRHHGSAQKGVESNHHTFQGKSQKSSLREQLHQKYNNILGDDAMEMIEQIERKALVQIQTLRKDKIELLKKLNNEIKQHNEQKKKNIALEAQIQYLREQLQKLGYNPQKKTKKSHEQSHRKTIDQPGQQSRTRNYPDLQGKRRASQNYQQMPQEPFRKQSYDYDPQVPTNEHQELQSQILRLEEENAYLKELIQNGNGEGMNEKLRAELSMLESKARSYESILRSPEQAGNGDWKNLLNEGHYLNQEGKKLMKINSKPQIKSRKSNDDSEKIRYFNEINSLKSRIKELEMENSSLSKVNGIKQVDSPQTYGYSSRQTRMPTYHFGHRPSTSNYEKIITEMKRVAKS